MRDGSHIFPIAEDIYIQTWTDCLLGETQTRRAGNSFNRNMPFFFDMEFYLKTKAWWPNLDYTILYTCFGIVKNWPEAGEEKHSLMLLLVKKALALIITLAVVM